MIKRELIRLGACALVGLVIGIIMASSNRMWAYVLLGPFYMIGTFYGVRLIVIALGGVGKTAGRSAFFSIAGGHWIGFLIIMFLSVIAIGLILTFGWIIGVIIAGKALFDAYRLDSEIIGTSGSNDDNDWDYGGGTSGRRSNKGRSSSYDDYDDMSW